MATIGICMATHNGARFLEQQLDSIAAQSFSDWHLYIRDDGSTDGTPEILRTFAAHHPECVTIVGSEQGQLGARGNFARLMEVASEPYLAFADQDDVWYPQKLASTLAAMRRTEFCYGPETPVMVHADRRLIDGAGREITPSYWASRGLDASRFRFGTCLSFCLAAGSAMLVNRPLISMALPIPDQARMHDTWLELVAHAFGVVTVTEEIVVDHRRHGANISGSASDNNSRAARRFWARAKRLLAGTGTQGRIYAGYLDQAAAFRRQYAMRLDPLDARRLAVFLSLPFRTVPARFWLVWRYDIAPPGLARRLAFVGILRPPRPSVDPVTQTQRPVRDTV